MKRVVRGGVIALGALAITALGIQASDSASGLRTSLSGLVSQSSGPCGEGEVQFLLQGRTMCVDQYEASPSEACPTAVIASQIDTQKNINEQDCVTRSAPELTPWSFVSLTQAQQLCARTQKRLPTNEEWYKLVSGFANEAACVIENNARPALTGSAASCVTPAGLYDMVGNVWEWVDAEVIDGTYEGRSLPISGYVATVDSNGVIVSTATMPESAMGNDYAWTTPNGVNGIIRGGYFGSGEDAGVYTQNLTVPLDFRTIGVGFRCVRDI